MEKVELGAAGHKVAEPDTDEPHQLPPLEKPLEQVHHMVCQLKIAGRERDLPLFGIGVEIGVAEQNLVTVASGMAAAGKIPFASSYAAFSPGRNYEQIRTTIALNNKHVIVVGSHAGVSVGPDGATHQMLEDIALMRVLPNK